MGKNLIKKLSTKYSQKLFDRAGQFVTDALKTASKRALEKTAKATGNMIGNKIGDKFIKSS